MIQLTDGNFHYDGITYNERHQGIIGDIDYLERFGVIIQRLKDGKYKVDTRLLKGLVSQFTRI